MSNRNFTLRSRFLEFQERLQQDDMGRQGLSCCYLIPRVYKFWVEWFTETGNIRWILSRLQCGTGWKNWRQSHLFTRIMLEVYMANCNIKKRKQGSLWVCRRFLPVEYSSRHDKNKGDHHAKREAIFMVFSEYQITVVFTKVWKSLGWEYNSYQEQKFKQMKVKEGRAGYLSTCGSTEGSKGSKELGTK